MKLVFYLLKKIFPLFLGALFFFSFVLNLVDLFMHISNYLQNGCTFSQMFRVMYYYIPKTIWYAVPVAMLFSTSYTLSLMYAQNELEALFASGVSLFRFTSPILFISIALSFGLFFFENNLVVQTFEKKNELQNEMLKKEVNENNSDVIVLSDNGKIIYKAAKYFNDTHKLQNACFVFRTEEKKMIAVIYAESAFWQEDEEKWILRNPVEYKLNEESKITKVSTETDLTDRLTENYDIFKKSNVDVQSVSAKEARIYVNHLKKAGLPYGKELSEYYKKFAFPFIVFIVVFLSIGLTGKTKKNVLLISLASCISSSVLFYVMMMVTMVLAKHGYMTPFMGAWSPVIVFTVASIILLRYSRT